ALRHLTAGQVGPGAPDSGGDLCPVPTRPGRARMSQPGPAQPWQARRPPSYARSAGPRGPVGPDASEKGRRMNANPGTERLDSAACLALLREAPFGRLAVIVDGRPDIFPVNHAVQHGSVVFRTSTGTKLHSAIGQPVAYEVDGYDQ